MYALMPKCEELSNSMGQVYKLADQIYPFCQNMSLTILVILFYFVHC